MSNSKLDASFACMQELATALIIIRDIPFPPSLIADKDAYRYAMTVRLKAMDGLDHLLRLHKEVVNGQ